MKSPVARRKKANLDLPQCPRSDFARLPLVQIDGESYPDYTAMADAYAKQCVDGSIDVGRYVQKAAKRYLTMRERAGKARCSYYWSDYWVTDVCDFVEKLPHVEAWAGLIELQPCQIWWFAAIYGFRRKSTGARLVRCALLILPRKNAKSTLTAGATLIALVLEGEEGPSIYIGASTLDQAGKVFEPARKMVEKDADLREHFQLRPRVRKIWSDLTQGSIETITSVAEAQDGHNSHMVVLEELHAQKHGLFQVMSSSMGARTNPLLWMITTAGRYARGLCWDQWNRAKRLLDGIYKNDEEFAVIYAADKEDLDDPYSDRTMRKTNPMWGISVIPENARSESKSAITDKTRRSEYLRTRLNVFSNAAEQVFDQDQWDACAHKMVPEDFAGCTCWIGIDLATRRDMVAASLVFEKGPVVASFVVYFIPADADALSDPDQIPMYEYWIEHGFVKKAGLGTIDLEPLETVVKGWCNTFNASTIAVDPSFAQHFASKLVNDGYPTVTFKNTAENMSEPTDDLIARVRAKTFWHDGNPVLAWNAANVVAHRNERGLILPRKENKDSPNKIDGVHSTIFANACRMKDHKPADDKPEEPHPWTTRGMRGFNENGELVN